MGIAKAKIKIPLKKDPDSTEVIGMKKQVILSILVILFPMILPIAFAEDSSGKDYFEKDSDEKQFSAKVKVIREISEDTEVFFDNPQAKGAYTLQQNSNFGSNLTKLQKSMKSRGPRVTISADDNNYITSVEIDESSYDDQRQPASQNNEDSNEPKNVDKEIDKLMKDLFK